MKKGILFVIWITLVMIPLSSPATQPSLRVIPYPREVRILSGTFAIPQELTVEYFLAGTSRLSRALEESDELVPLSRTVQHKQTLKIGIPEEAPAFRELCIKKRIWPEGRIGDEGYVLFISRNEIIIAGNTSTGLFYGIQTLNQILRGASDRHIPAVHVVDWPVLPFRGMQDDISRGPVPTMDFMKKQVRRAAELKLNRLSYYTEHVVSTKSHGDFAPPGAGVTIEEWKELSDYAEGYHIQLVGNFQSFGHFEKILAFPQYRHLGVSGRMLSPVDPESYELLADIYAEMAPAFSSEYFNVNSDETWDLGRGATKAVVDSLGTARVYASHMNRIYQELEKHGKKMMMWADIALEHPEILGYMPRDVVMATWIYDPRESYEAYIQPLKTAGFDVIVCPGVLNSNRLMPELDTARENISGFVADGIRFNADGMMLTVWDDGGMALFSRDWYGVAWAAEMSWNGENRGTGDFDFRFNRSVYGNRTNHFTEAMMKILDLADLSPTQEMNDNILWQQFIPDYRQHLLINLTDWDKVIRICDEAESLLHSGSIERYREDQDYFQFNADQYRLLAKSRFLMIAAAEAYYQALSSGFVSPSRTRELLTEALDKTGQIESGIVAERNRYRELWLDENHVYWLHHILRQYDERIEALRDIQKLLVSALYDFEKGIALPDPGEVRLDIERAVGDYFQGWLICGPFPNPEGARGSDTDYLEAMGGEKNAKPFAGEVIEGPAGKQVEWNKYFSPIFGQIDLAHLFEENEDVLAYAQCRIISPKDETVMASLGSNDGIQVFIGGEKVFEKRVMRNLALDEDRFMLPLDKGTNYLTLKIFQGNAGWGFSFRLPDNIVETHKYRYTILE